MVAESQLQAILAHLAEAVTIVDTEGRLVYINEAAAELFGYRTAEQALQVPLAQMFADFELFDEHGEPFDPALLPGRRALAGEQPTPVTIRRRHVHTGEERWLTIKASAVPDEGTGRPALAVNVIEDVTAARRAHETTTFLSEASKLLASSLDFETTLSAVAQAAVPQIADWCAVDLVADDGTVGRVASAQVEPAREPASILRVPMTSGERTIGTISFGAADGRPPLTDADRELGEELGRRAGVAVENARVHRERSRIAATLQRSLLPPRLPVVPGLSLAARFRAAGEANQVGGDFYDLFAVDNGWMVIIGDVTGKGPGAAAITSLARYTIRTAAIFEPEPARVMRRLNDALIGDADSPQMCTAVCLLITPPADDGRIRMELVCAGHPPPYLLRGPGHLEELCRPGPLLGAFATAEWEPFSIELCPGDGIVLYTDGVTDARGGDGLFGTDRLEAVLREAAGGEADEIAETIDGSLLAFQEGPQRDDVALLVLRAGTAADAPESTLIAASSTVPT